MKDETFLALSFSATIVFGMLAMVGLLVAALVLGERGAALCALYALGAAYLSQAFATRSLDVPVLGAYAVLLQVISVLIFLVGLLCL